MLSQHLAAAAGFAAARDWHHALPPQRSCKRLVHQRLVHRGLHRLALAPCATRQAAHAAHGRFVHGLASRVRGVPLMARAKHSPNDEGLIAQRAPHVRARRGFKRASFFASRLRNLLRFRAAVYT